MRCVHRFDTLPSQFGSNNLTLRLRWRWRCGVSPPPPSPSLSALFLLSFVCSLTHSHTNYSTIQRIVLSDHNCSRVRISVRSHFIHRTYDDTVVSGFGEARACICCFVLFCYSVVLITDICNINIYVLTQPGTLNVCSVRKQRSHETHKITAARSKFTPMLLYGFHSERVRTHTWSNCVVILNLFQQRWRETKKKHTHTQNLILCFCFLLLTFDL